MVKLTYQRAVNRPSTQARRLPNELTKCEAMRNWRCVHEKYEECSQTGLAVVSFHIWLWRGQLKEQLKIYGK